MMKTIVCIALVLCVAQGSVLDTLKRLLEEKELQARGVYKVSKTSTSISGTVQIDINDCPKPEDGCQYTITASNTAGNDAQTQSVRTKSTPVTFSFDNLDPSGVYEVTGCILINGQYSCSPKSALCDMRTRSNSCNYDMAKKKLDTRGVMALSADSSSITGTVQVDISDCPKPYNCDYTVSCRNQQSGDVSQFIVNTKNSATRPFECKDLSGGVYQISACKNGNSQCGPRIGTCDLSTGKCSLKMSSSVKKAVEDKNTIIDKIADLLEQMRQ